MSMKKYAKLPKKLRITKKNPAVWRIANSEAYYRQLFGLIHYPLWLLRPICWLKRHKNKWIYPYGMKLKQCRRCAKIFYKRPIKGEKQSFLYSGEIGSLYGVKFITIGKTKQLKTCNHCQKKVKKLYKVYDKFDDWFYFICKDCRKLFN